METRGLAIKSCYRQASISLEKRIEVAQPDRSLRIKTVMHLPNETVNGGKEMRSFPPNDSYHEFKFQTTKIILLLFVTKFNVSKRNFIFAVSLCFTDIKLLFICILYQIENGKLLFFPRKYKMFINYAIFDKFILSL